LTQISNIEIRLLKMGSETEEKVRSYSNQQRKIIALCMAVCLMLVPLSQDFHASLGTDGINIDHISSIHDPIHVNLPSSTNDNLDIYQHCEQEEAPSVNSPGTFTTKPIWTAMMPFTLAESFHKNLINPLTGTTAGGKSFYSSVKGKLRHCIGNGQSVTCLNVHPNVEMTKGMPDSKASEFYGKYIMVLRNPMTSFPATYNAKSAKYSGTVGQLPEEQWRDVRDQWFDGMLEAWRNSIVTWSQTTYDLGMYLVFEDLFNMERGIGSMKKLRVFLQEAGFEVATEDELSCILYRAASKEDMLKKFQKRRYEYDDYIPGYTVEQQNKMLNEFLRMKKEFSNDSELIRILDQYEEEIQTTIKIDENDVESRSVATP
jgi:hypothetical protein